MERSKDDLIVRLQDDVEKLNALLKLQEQDAQLKQDKLQAKTDKIEKINKELNQTITQQGEVILTLEGNLNSTKD